MAGWTRESLFFSGEDYYRSLESRIDEARLSIVMEVYIFRLDRVGSRILQALAKAASRGVRVRLLIDGVGSSEWGMVDVYHWRERGIELSVYHPLPWQAKPMSFSMLGKLNRRNHRKVAVIDNRIAFVGGMNICESHSEVYSGIQAWRDTMLELEGPAILALLEAFESAWAAPIHEIFNIKIKKNFLQQKEDRRRREIAWLNWVRRNHSRRLRAHARHYLLRRFVMANRRIWITTPYFVPPPKMLHLLRKMAWSGVDVRLIVPKKSDIWFMTWVSRAFYFSMLRAGVRVFEYEPRVLHAKTMIVDDWFLVGSANFNHRSFLHDLEVEVRVAESSSRAVLVSQFEIDQAFSSEVLPTTWARRMFIPRIVGWFFTRFRYWF